MAKAKLTGEQIKLLAVYGIKTPDAETAKTELVAQLAENGLSDVDGDDIDTLLQYREAFDAPAPAPAKKAPAKAETETEEEEEPAAKPKAKATPPAKKAPVKKAAETEEELDDLAEEVKSAPKAAPKKTAAKADKAETAKKSTNGTTFDKNDADHLALITKKLVEFFPKKDFGIAPIVGGVTVRYLGENAKVVIIKFNNVRIVTPTTISGDLNFKKIKDVKDLEALLPDDMDKKVEKVSGRNYCKIVDINDTEIAALFGTEGVLDTLKKQAEKIDTKMGNNRKQMEESIATPAPKAKAKAKAQPEEEAEEEVEEPVTIEEEEEEAPAPKAKKKAKK